MLLGQSPSVILLKAGSDAPERELRLLLLARAGVVFSFQGYTQEHFEGAAKEVFRSVHA